ncbi:MAG TPA: transcriptional regulator [Gemmatimonadaceae bacterium]|nr:transcriptional regulator [Gemmatimonadaceae bacterium]
MARSGALPRNRADGSSAGDGRLRSESGGGGRPTPTEPLELDSLIHNRMRLGIVSALAANDALTFNELKSLMRTTDGNLSVHARKLEEAKYVICSKSFEGRRPRTEYRLAAAGRRALQRYLAHMEALIERTRETLDR